jgi:phenylalanyl-tRNA synthetase beta chain
MRIPLSWLKEYVNITLPPEELAERLTMAGFEVEALDYIGTEPPTNSAWAPDLSGTTPPAHIPWDAERVLVGELLDVQQHPNADRLTLPLVGYGDGRSLTLVTGAPNIKVGMKGQKVALALAGARLIDGHSDTRRWLTLKPGKIRGVVSEGMVCSELELGLSDEHEGILFLPDDAPVGVPLRDYLGDVVFDIYFTPDKAYAMSVVGIAREVAALTGQPLNLVEPQVVAEGPSIEEHVRVTVEDGEDCPRFTAGMIEDVQIGPSPAWMQQRLRLAGMRPISNIVDVTNYVMLEWGQPSHAFDADTVAERHLIVRRAHDGEQLETLDGKQRQLNSEIIVVADERGAQSLAGVMGGAATEVSDQTRNVLLEIARWNPARIRRTVQALKLPSEASRRFERGIDPELPPLAQQRALGLMQQVAGGTVYRGLIDVNNRPWHPCGIELTSAEVRRLLGIDLSAAQIADLLEPLGFECEIGVDSVLVVVPSHRLDVTLTADLVEEVARMYGYDRIPTTRMADELPPQYIDEQQLAIRLVKDTLVACGLTEAITYSLTSPAAVAAFDGAQPNLHDYIQIETPTAPERAVLRREILPELAQALSANLREQPRVALFETGRVFWPQPDAVLPHEPQRLAIVMAGEREPLSWHNVAPALMDFFDLKGVIETLLERLGLTETVMFTPADDGRFHPGRSAYVVHGEQRLGVLGELHPATRDRLELSVGRAVAAELDLETLLQLRQPAHYAAIQRQPAVYQDIAFIAPTNVTAERMRGLIAQTAGALLEEITLFDVYTGAPIPEGQRSLAFRLRFRAPDRTLTDGDVNKIRDKIARRLGHELGATIRA